jgi:predicted nucleic acid-binding Zn ribbon protein
MGHHKAKYCSPKCKATSFYSYKTKHAKCIYCNKPIPKEMLGTNFCSVGCKDEFGKSNYEHLKEVFLKGFDFDEYEKNHPKPVLEKNKPRVVSVSKAQKCQVCLKTISVRSKTFSGENGGLVHQSCCKTMRG